MPSVTVAPPVPIPSRDAETPDSPSSCLLLRGFPSVHSIRDIPFVGDESEANDSSYSRILPKSASFSSLELSEKEKSLVSADTSLATGVSLDDLIDTKRELDEARAYVRRHAHSCTINMILASVLERVNDPFNNLLHQLGSRLNSLDPQMFVTLSDQLRDLHHQLWKITPKSEPFANVSKLTSLVKWDYCQMISSFLTLLRTSPAFIASAYLELDPTQAANFAGPRSLSLGDVTLLDKTNPLEVLYYGLFRENKHRINYFAALCAQVAQQGQDALCMAVFNKFNSRPMNGAFQLQLDRFLRKFIQFGGFLASPTRPGSSPDLSHQDYLDTNAQELIRLLSKREAFNPSFICLVATMRRLMAPEILQRLVTSYLLHGIQSWTSCPQSYGMLGDTYISENTRRFILAPLTERFAQLLEEPQGQMLLDAVLGVGLEVSNIEEYHAAGQYMVLSISDIAILFNSLLPPNICNASHDEETEWCFGNIRADMEPVIKEISLKLPYLQQVLSQKNSPGIFAEFWQVFTIDAGGLVNEVDKHSWDDELELSAAANAIGPGVSLRDMLEAALVDAEDSGDVLKMFQLDSVLRRPPTTVLSAVASELNRRAKSSTNMAMKLSELLKKTVDELSDLKFDGEKMMARLDHLRLLVCYETEIRPSSQWSRANEVVKLLVNEKSPSPATRRYSARPRRLSILSSQSLTDSFFVSRDYLGKPKLADREVDVTSAWMHFNHIHNFNPPEELLHRFNCEISHLMAKVLDPEFLATTTIFRSNVKREPLGRRTHRMSMSVLPDSRSGFRYTHQGRRSSPNLLDIFDWRSSESVGSESGHVRLGLAFNDPSSAGLDRDMLCGLLLSDLGADFLDKRFDVDQYMQQTGRMFLSGESGVFQTVLDDISVQSSPARQLEKFQTLAELAELKLESDSGTKPSRADVISQLQLVLCREPGTLFRDLQLVSAFVPVSKLDSTPAGQAFWDVAEAASNIVEQVMAKSMGLADRILQYNLEAGSISAITNIGISDAVAIWSFCARYGRKPAQRKLAQLYVDFPHTQLEIAPFSRPALVFDGVELAGAREAVVAHWVHQAAERNSEFI